MNGTKIELTGSEGCWGNVSLRSSQSPPWLVVKMGKYSTVVRKNADFCDGERARSTVFEVFMQCNAHGTWPVHFQSTVSLHVQT